MTTLTEMRKIIEQGREVKAEIMRGPIEIELDGHELRDCLERIGALQSALCQEKARYLKLLAREWGIAE